MNTFRRQEVRDIALRAFGKRFNSSEYQALLELDALETEYAIGVMEGFLSGREFEQAKQKSCENKALDWLIGLDQFKEAGVRG